MSENDLKREITLAINLLRNESKLRISLEQFLSFITTYKAAFDCYSLPVTSASCESNVSKMKLEKIFPRNSMTSEKLGNIDIL